MPNSRKMPIGLLVEQYGPVITAVIVFTLLLFFSDYFSEKFGSNQWKSAGLYSAIFGWSAIQTGFAFGVYGFVIGKQDGFVHALRGTKAFARFEKYIKSANLVGLFLTFPCIILMVIEPSIATPLGISYILVSAWFSVFVWAFLSFCRLAYNFGAIASVRDKVK